MFKPYRRVQIAELRPVIDVDILMHRSAGVILTEADGDKVPISISKEDMLNGSPKIGDMIARNPKNHKDQWLIAEQYFKDNFEELI